MSDVVVLIHGIWMTTLELRPLAWRLRRCGYTCRYFYYPSLRRRPADNARRLAAYLQQLDAPRVHLVAHSLGGIVLSHLFEQGAPARVGRVVMLGTPLQGSVVARHLYQRRVSRVLLGRASEAGLLGDAPTWRGEAESGMIAGTHSFGIGQFLAPGKLVPPHDGTVAVSETRSPALQQHRTVHCSHLSMLFSHEVGEQVCHFLQQGRFT